ncbi:hypothetical protein GQ53DRAFT_333305 [Thozetella sp. PMI_491]|nr:hypothetical protein GQ53DRAFT_333305 [Thozetella sp. PMI_491]
MSDLRVARRVDEERESRRADGILKVRTGRGTPRPEGQSAGWVGDKATQPRVQEMGKSGDYEEPGVQCSGGRMVVVLLKEEASGGKTCRRERGVRVGVGIYVRGRQGRAKATRDAVRCSNGEWDGYGTGEVGTRRLEDATPAALPAQHRAQQDGSPKLAVGTASGTQHPGEEEKGEQSESKRERKEESKRRGRLASNCHTFSAFNGLSWALGVYLLVMDTVRV